MTEFQLLFEHLAEGTASQKRRAWEALVNQGALWRGCQAALRHPTSPWVLAAAHARLAGDWNASPLAARYGGDSRRVEELLAAARRIVAAAALAACSRYAPEDGQRLQHWTWRAA